MLPEMNDKGVDIESITQKSLDDKELLAEILDGLKSKNETLRYNCYKVLMLISEKNGELLYPEWDYFVKLLGSENSYHRMSAIHLIANLIKVDTEDRFEKVFDKYYSLLDDKSMIVAIYVAASSGKIVKAKPKLESRITDRLLDIDNTYHNEGHKQLVKAGVIEAFDQYFTEAADKEGIIAFVKAQQHSDSLKTRKLTQDFLRKREK